MTFSPGEDDSFLDPKGWTEVVPEDNQPKRRWFRRKDKRLGLAQVHSFLKDQGTLPDTTRSRGTGKDLITIDGTPTEVVRGPQNA